MNERRGPAITPDPSATLTDTNGSRASITDGADQRARWIRRQATIDLVRLAYGPAADLRPTPPGPDVCPSTCRYCAKRRVA